jgi:CHAT domain-containing protein
MGRAGKARGMTSRTAIDSRTTQGGSSRGSFRLALTGCALGSTLLLAGAPAPPTDPVKERWSAVERRVFAGQPAGDLDYRERAPEPRRIRGLHDARPSFSLPSRLGADSLEEIILDLDASLDAQGSPRNPAELNDLALALLERSAASERALLDLHRARRLLDEGLAAPHPGKREPGSIPSRRALLFNRALCLERLQLPSAAAAAWRAYLEADASSGWSREAQERLSRLEVASRESRWKETKIRLLAGEVDPAKIIDWAREFPLEIRQFAEEDLLGRWAADASAEIPPQAEQIAHALVDLNQDSLLSDHLQALRFATASPRGWSVARLAQTRYVEAMALYASERRLEAQSPFSMAAVGFAAIASPYAEQSRLYAAICLYHWNTPAAQREFLALTARIDGRQHPSLAGRSLWMAGSSPMVQGQLESAIVYFERMRDFLRRGDGPAQAAVADTNLAAVYGLRGEATRSWVHLLRSMEATRHHTYARRRYAPFFEAAKAAWRLDDLPLTRLYLDEALALNQEKTAWRAEALSLRARVFDRQGLKDLAEDDALAALNIYRALPDRRSFQRTATLVNQALADTLLPENPEDALLLLNASIRDNEQDDWQVEALELLQTQAQAYLVQGNKLQARNSLLRSVERIDQMRNEAVAPQTKIEIFEQARSTIDQLVALGLEEFAETPEFTLADAELMRSLFMPSKDKSNKNRSLDEELSQKELIVRAAALPKSVTLIKFHVLADRVAIWALHDGRIEPPIVKEIRREELQHLVRAFRASLQQGSRNERLRLGSVLYDLLLRPVEAALAGKELLGLVPDRSLVSLPFAALYDARTEQLLIQRMELTTLPTLSKGAFHDGAHRRRQRRALVIGAPDLHGTPWAGLAPLPAAREEALAIADLYSTPDFLSERTATRGAFLRKLEQYDVIHFAGHGASTGPAIDDQKILLAPDYAGGPAEVTGLDLLPLNLNRAELVVLAACDSSGGFETADPGRWGLAASLLLAGARNVVTTFWEIEDSFSLSFMERFHRLVVEGRTPTSALREVMLQEIHQEKDSNDFQWTAFSVSGY